MKLNTNTIIIVLVCVAVLGPCTCNAQNAKDDVVEAGTTQSGNEADSAGFPPAASPNSNDQHGSGSALLYSQSSMGGISDFFDRVFMRGGKGVTLPAQMADKDKP